MEPSEIYAWVVPIRTVGDFVLPVLATLIVFIAVLYILFALPMSAAFLRGLAAARDPSHRITLAPPVKFFRMGFKRAVGRWPLAWLALLALGTQVSLSLHGLYMKRNDPSGFYYGFRLTLGTISPGVSFFWLGLGFGLFFIASLYLFAPRFERATILAGSATLCAAVSLLSTFWLYEFLLWRMSPALWALRDNHTLLSCLAGLFAFWACRSVALKKGDGWFGFE